MKDFYSLTCTVPHSGSQETKTMAVLEQVMDAMLPVDRARLTPNEYQDHLFARERVAKWVLAKFGA
jgi:hypothetical protein